ncbi:hypothetical protein ACFVZM_00270 [Streptomyces sioyaensis]|uniref:hypothetical protein n=1 Tax=Streptomyces sioyaensis TaxID=67364 RepID=UPI003686ED55
MSRGGALRRLAAHEGRWLVSLVWWVARRRIGVASGERALGYAATQAALMYGLAFVCVVETVGLSALLGGSPVVHGVVLVLDVYTVLMVLGLQASAVTRPHVLGADVLWLRDGARRELRIPVGRIASVRYDLRFSREEGRAGDGAATGAPAGVAEFAVGGQTSVSVELVEPVVVVGLLGQRATVGTVRFHADDPRAAVRAVREAVAGAGDGSRGDATGAGGARVTRP